MKALLLTDVPPCKLYSGALLTYHLCKNLKAEEIVCVAVRNRDLSYLETSEDLNISTEYFTKPYENTNWFFKGKMSWFSFFYELYAEYILVPKLAKKIAEFAKKQNVDRLWCILQGQTMIRLAKILSKMLDIPLLTQVWDHPVWWVGHNNVDDWSSKRIIKRFNQVMLLSKGFGAASYSMAEWAKNEFSVPSVPLVSSLPSNFGKESQKFFSRNDNDLIIGFSGQTYANQALNTLIYCLDTMNWELNGKQIKLRFLGYHISFGGHYKRNIEYLGYRSQQETLDLLSDCDLLFCPYITDPKYHLVAQTSFPAKLTTYLATGVPILFLGTANSSPATFIKKFNAGYVCSDMDNEKLKTLLISIFSNKEDYELIAKNGVKAFNDCLTNEVLAKDFKKFLDYGDASL